MTCMTNTKSKRYLSARLATGLMLAGFLTLGSVVVSASAEERHDDRRGWDHHDDRDHRGWGGGYYGAPPVVYGNPGYSPPVVYGPSLGIIIR